MTIQAGLGGVLALVALPCGRSFTTVPAAQDAPAKVSEFGRYEGWSEERFSEWTTFSRYLEMRDGVKLAIDVTRPAVDGVPVDEPLPVVWTHSRYHRNPSQLMAMFSRGGLAPDIRSMVDVQADLQLLVKHGYVVAAVGVRGSGASFGRFEGLFSEAETKDAFEITAWLADQSWCDGNVGMFGGSYLGITQYMNASLAPPALKAIFPVVAAFDMYDLIYPGGVFRSDMMGHWAKLTRQLDLDTPAPRVDGDTEGEWLAAALAQHEDNWDVMEEYGAGRFRDYAAPTLNYAEHGPSAFLAAINAARVPAYHMNGWYDIFVSGATLWYANYAGPQKLTIGAWAHAGMPDMQLNAERARLNAIEQHRWFDRWLKGVENGIDDGAPVNYALMDEPGEWVWQSAAGWPLADARPTRFWFGAGPSGSVGSVNDGLLLAAPPEGSGAGDAYEVDPTTTTGMATRWDNAVGAARVMMYPDLAPNDAKSLTYTTPPLEHDVVVVGHPVVTLYVTSDTGDADFHVLLEEVDADGVSRYVTEGVLRGSLRALAEAPWDNMGLPYQRCFREDQAPLSADEPSEVVMDLHPTATIFNAGHRIRVTIMGRDADNTEAPPGSARTTVRVFRGGERASSIVLPILGE